ncbi:MAG: DUF6596 domain-containing protein [Pseudomonadota bacterium]
MSPSVTDNQAKARAEHVARAAYGRLIAILAKRSGDIAAAEDALADAFAQALETWPKNGAPDSPEAWLLTVAKNRQRDVAKSAANKTAAGSLDDESFKMNSMPTDTAKPHGQDIPDERLKLLFACAHPAIDSTVHTPLMLQTVLGLEANEIASAYLMPGATLAQRLVRAKRKIKDARIPFEIPDQSEIKSRLDGVLEAIYGAYSLSWQDAENVDVTRDLAKEALYLSTVVTDMLPEEAEALGLAALVALSMARRQARLTAKGVHIPTDQQNTALWDKMLIRRGETLLTRAAAQKAPGRFQIEATIQLIHCDRANSGLTDWAAIAQLYNGLIAFAPTMGAAVARAAAVGHAFGAKAGLNALATVDAGHANAFQPYWATAAYLHRMAGDESSAQAAYRKAIDLCTDLPTRKWLERIAQDKVASLH